ncbi:hypothetical protein J5N97_027612 [Dioscorea zingiberensis]|uniref:Pentatricopeptide repeat-containing protein n=1 Tax=Dioscorea zingiberensis TaxID=325984 RepID=A0A9D5C555_9LILI|nr:hypothetical protein J5N97_027612 [Dioscorea zingiberensis]
MSNSGSSVVFRPTSSPVIQGLLKVLAGIDTNFTVTSKASDATKTSGTGLLDMYVKCGKVSDARCIFDELCDVDLVSWTAMVVGYTQKGCPIEALKLFSDKKWTDIIPNSVTIASALSASRPTERFIFRCRLRLLTDAITVRRSIFNEMNERNTVTWCAMMMGGTMQVQGDSADSIALFSKMLEEKLSPNDVTFTNILSACSHTGMVSEGQKYFDIMLRDHGITPSMKHYACMVDMLARAGWLEDALKFIKRMPMQPEVNVWGAFLHGCRIHSRLDLGEMAAKRVIELHPETADYYVLVTNFYSLMGMWTEADEVRRLMKGRRLNKSPGLSFVSLDNGLSYVLHSHGNQDTDLLCSFS